MMGGAPLLVSPKQTTRAMMETRATLKVLKTALGLHLHQPLQVFRWNQNHPKQPVSMWNQNQIKPRLVFLWTQNQIKPQVVETLIHLDPPWLHQDGIDMSLVLRGNGRWPLPWPSVTGVTPSLSLIPIPRIPIPAGRLLRWKWLLGKALMT